MVNMRDIYNTWKLDQSYTKHDLPILLERLGMKYFTSKKYNTCNTFDYSNDGLCSKFHNIKNEIFYYEDNIIKYNQEPILAFDIDIVTNNLCDILLYCEGFYDSGYNDCILEITNYSLKLITKVALKYKSISKYYYNTQVIYFILKGYLDILFEYIEKLHMEEDILEEIAINILLLIDAIDKQSNLDADNIAPLYDLKGYLVKERDKIYSILKRKDDDND